MTDSFKDIAGIGGGIAMAFATIYNTGRMISHGEQMQRRLFTFQELMQQKSLDFQREQAIAAALENRDTAIEVARVTTETAAESNFNWQQWPLTFSPKSLLEEYKDGNPLARKPPATVIFIPPLLENLHEERQITNLASIYIKHILHNVYQQDPDSVVDFKAGVWSENHKAIRAGAAEMALFPVLNSLPLLLTQCDINADILTVWCGGWVPGQPRTNLFPFFSVNLADLRWGDEANPKIPLSELWQRLANDIASIVGLAMVSQLDMYFLQRSSTSPRLPQAYAMIKSLSSQLVHPALETIVKGAAAEYDYLHRVLYRDSENLKLPAAEQLNVPLQSARLLAALGELRRARAVVDQIILESWFDQRGNKPDLPANYITTFSRVARPGDLELVSALREIMEVASASDSSLACLEQAEDRLFLESL